MNCAIFTLLLSILSITVNVVLCSPQITSTTDVKKVPPEPAYNTTTAEPTTTTTKSTTTTSTTPSTTTTSTTTTAKPTTTTTSTTTTTDKPTTSTTPDWTSPATASTTPSGPVTTPFSPVSPTPSSKGRHFDAISFMGGMILTACVIGLSVATLKFYKMKREASYRTL